LAFTGKKLLSHSWPWVCGLGLDTSGLVNIPGKTLTQSISGRLLLLPRLKLWTETRSTT